ncbi:hypothetical protein Trydic_g16541 [Trypoxylus dichotomus]
MKLKRNNLTIKNERLTSVLENKTLWFNQIPNDPTDFPLACDEAAITLKQEAKQCIDLEIANFNNKNTKNNSDYRWMKMATQKGTVSDKIAASIVLIQDSPITNLDMLRNLVSMVKVGKKKECTVVIDTLTELFLTCLLKPNLKLKPFHQRPLMQLAQISSGNARTRQKYLAYWYFEDQLKEIYAHFVLALNTAAHDTLDVNKEKAIGAMYRLLEGNPEQEKHLLIHVVNKLGDPSQKVASKAIYCLNQLLFKHINMQNVVLSEIEKLLFRTNVAQKAQYYAICFLSQFYLSHDSANTAAKLIEVYFSFFRACIKQGEVDSRMMSALLMGVNRAYPYAKVELERLEEHIDTLYRVVHIANFNVGLHALMLLHQVSDNANNMNNRYYSALYKKINDPKLLTTTHQAMFLNLIYKSLMKDLEASRIKAFIKRLLQIALFVQPAFACGILYLISQIMSKKSNIQAITLEEIDKLSLAKFDGNEEEKYDDIVDSEVVIKVDDDDDNEGRHTVQNVTNEGEDVKDEKVDIEVLNTNMKQCPSWYHCSTTVKQEKKDPTTYDPFNRNPLFAGAQYSAYMELLNLKCHYHPTVSLYATKLLQGDPINYTGDPLKDFSLIRFLDRFVFKNPKKFNSNDGSHPTFGKRKKYKPFGLRSLALNSEKYLQQNETNIPVDELFLYKYMQKKTHERKKEDEDSDIESVASDEFEELLNKMGDHKEMDDDLDYIYEIGNNLKPKSNRLQKDDDASNESDNSDVEDNEMNDIENYDSDPEIDDDMEPDNDDNELIEGLDDDNMSDIVFKSGDQESCSKKIRKRKKKDDLNSVFASAEEFASLLEDDESYSKMAGSSNELSNKDNASAKQLVWEGKRNHWLQGYNKAIGKRDEDNWTQILEGEWMVEFYAPWCPACKGLEPVWKEFSTWADDLEIKVAQVDVTTSPGLSGRFMVTALPTIFHVINGQFRQYKGTRDKDSFISFIEDKKWRTVEPISSWKSPASFQMSVVSYFFRLSQILRRVHNQLMEDFGLPTWGSYLIFAIGTIILGALLGLILVCCIDLIYPPKCSTAKKSDDKAKRDKGSDKHSGDELADEDIKDDLIDLQDEQKSEPEDKEDKALRSNTSSPTIKKRKPRKD